jgi:hypothetical protein
MRWTILIVLAWSGAAAAQMSPPVPPANPPANCTGAEHRQFDFWVGEWKVFQTARPDEMVGGSVIESVYNGCGIRENWLPFSLQTGGSLNSYDPDAKVWRQAWIDSSNARVDFEGGLRDGKMVMAGQWRDYAGPGKDALIRMTWSQEAGGAVRQLGESSDDGGKSWKPSFDFTYRRKDRK